MVSILSSMGKATMVLSERGREPESERGGNQRRGIETGSLGLA
jgi:hypothetical protein